MDESLCVFEPEHQEPVAPVPAHQDDGNLGLAVADGLLDEVVDRDGLPELDLAMNVARAAEVGGEGTGGLGCPVRRLDSPALAYRIPGIPLPALPTLPVVGH
jgi:hypothetical protein